MIQKFLNSIISRTLPNSNSIQSKKFANITNPLGKLPLDSGPFTFVVIVGPSFDQNVPNAMMTCRMGYCHAFELLKIPYIILDFNYIKEELPKLVNPFCIIFGTDYAYISNESIEILKKIPHFVWVDPWFKESEKFFSDHKLDSKIWTWSEDIRQKIIESQPSFVYTATVESGLHFFEEWNNNGLDVVSLPLACDTSLYNLSAPDCPEFENVKVAFVGGYWESKGRQIDKYLRPFEDKLIVYGYNKWPYKGYRGQLSREAEPSLYRQALVCPTINEPTVKLLHGQINERVFKILGCGGMTIVDAVPWYRELFSEDELIIPNNELDFRDIIEDLLVNEKLRDKYSENGYNAVISRHTYINRAKEILNKLDLHT